MKKDSTLAELLFGIIFLGAVFQAGCLIISKEYIHDAAGLWTGVAIACFMAAHMKKSIEETLDTGPDGAERHARNAYLMRTFIALLIMGTVIYLGWANPITLILGILSLKLSAYMQPWTHRIFTRIRRHVSGDAPDDTDCRKQDPQGDEDI